MSSDEHFKRHGYKPLKQAIKEREQESNKPGWDKPVTITKAPRVLKPGEALPLPGAPQGR